jgi:two-component system, cell cycle response regulator DivK
MSGRRRSAGDLGSRSANITNRSAGGSQGESELRDGDRIRPAGRKCILIVEDHPLNMKLFRALLESQSYRTLEATEANIGLELAREHDPDLIVMDVELPDISGIDAIRALKADERTRHIPIVTVTASMPYEEPKIRAAGSEGFMTKPIAAADFLATIRSFLEDERDS